MKSEEQRRIEQELMRRLKEKTELRSAEVTQPPQPEAKIATDGQKQKYNMGKASFADTGGGSQEKGQEK